MDGAAWALVGLALALAILLATLVWLWLLGRLTLDLGWGRSRIPLGPIEMAVEAQPDVVYEIVASPYLGRTPRELRSSLEVLEQGSGLVVAAHRTRLSGFTSTTVESVRFEPLERVTFRLLRGIAPSGREEFSFTATTTGTVFRYQGELEMALWLLGRLAGRHLIAPTWERVVRQHMQDIKRIAEDRARRSPITRRTGG